MRVLNDFGRPGLGVRRRLGYVQGSPEEAALSFVLGAKAFEGVSTWGIPTADWAGATSRLAYRSSVEIENLKKNVIGKLGNPEAEKAAALLLEDWEAQKDLADYAVKNPPSWAEQTKAKLDQFLFDFKVGALEAWQGYSAVVLSMAPPVLESYWDSVSKINILKKDLEDARASGKFSNEVLDRQAAQIAGAEAKVESIRGVYASMSLGGTIDKVAQDAYGPYRLSGALALAPTTAVGLVAIAVLAVALAYMVSNIKNLITLPKNIYDYLTDPNNRDTIALLSVVVLSAIFIPYLMKD